MGRADCPGGMTDDDLCHCSPIVSEFTLSSVVLFATHGGYGVMDPGALVDSRCQVGSDGVSFLSESGVVGCGDWGSPKKKEFK